MSEKEVAAAPSKRATEETLLYNVARFVAALLLVFIAAGIFSPSAQNWGVHQLAFLSPMFQIITLVVMVSLLFPATQLFLLDRIDKVQVSIRARSRFQQYGLAGAGILLLATLFWVGRVKLFFLGDGYLLLTKVREFQSLENIPEYFPNEPLAGLALYYIQQVSSALGYSEHPELSFQALSIGSGIGFMVCSGLLAYTLTRESYDGILLFLFVVASGICALFFGYIEMYAPACFACSLFFLAVARYLNGKNSRAVLKTTQASFPKFFIGNLEPFGRDSRLNPAGMTVEEKFLKPPSIVFPAIAYALLVCSYLAMLCLFPAYLYLLYRAGQKKFFDSIKGLLITAVIIAAVFILCGYDGKSFSGIFFDKNSHLLPLTVSDPVQQAYSLFSFSHATELIQLFFLNGMFVPVLLAAALFAFRKKIHWSANPVQFLSIGAICCFGLVLLLKPDLGMSRDWDLFAPLFVAMSIAAGYVILCAIPVSLKIRQTMVMAGGVAFLHAVSWIGLNGSEKQSLERFHILPAEQTWSKAGLLDAYERLAIYHRGEKDGRRAVEYYQKYLSIDSTNPRLWGSMGYVYELMGDEKNQLLAYAGAFRHGSENSSLLTDLGKLYVRYRQSGQALPVLQKAIQLEPGRADAHYYLGAALFTVGNFPLSLYHLKETIRLNPEYQPAYLGVIRIHVMNQELNDAGEVFQRYLRYLPQSVNVDSLRGILGLKK